MAIQCLLFGACAGFVLRSGSGHPHKVACNESCSMADTGQGLVHTIRVKGCRIKILRSMEGPQHYPQIRKRLPNMLLSTTSFQSDFPITYYTPSRPIYTAPPAFADTIPAAVFVARNCHSLNHREDLVKALGEHIRVDSVSACLHNANNPTKDKVKLVRQYRVYLAFENQNEHDHVTEKVYDGLEAGVPTVYLGAPNALSDNLVPSGSIIHANEFKTPRLLALFIRRLLTSETSWQAAHQWRLARDPNFDARFAFAADHIDCRICRGLRSYCVT